uniref:Ribosome assembly factor mrt4 n=1 Tax=Corethron hystrix TaxID=216773 RepID=A0A7S1FR25_9STRA|mmetsp:Transcript_22173/g.50758  ORF Transcript_22173/g.50758 Transcript_22173/m.50758 type:complete len:238 (+) Transcript_22173:222-935(+)
MPVSKRKNPVALTNTTSRSTKSHKSAYIASVRESIDDHSSLYLFSYTNMRSNHFKNVRMHFRETQDKDDMNDSDEGVGGGRILLGKNKLLQVALGRNEAEEYATNLGRVSTMITGNVGLIMTNQSREEVVKYIQNYSVDDFARAGSIASRSVTISNAEVVNFPVSMVEQFRKLGMAVDVKNGSVKLTTGETYTICKEGQTLTAEACRLLVHFGIKLAEFKIKLICRWDKNTEDLEEF